MLDVTSRCIRIIKKPIWRCLAANAWMPPVAWSVGLVQALLCAVASLPGRLQPGNTRLEQRLTFGVDGCALLGTNHERPHALTIDAAFIRERFAVSEASLA